MLSSYRTESLEANREQEAEVLHTTDSPRRLEARVEDTAEDDEHEEQEDPSMKDSIDNQQMDTDIPGTKIY
jgi:hypothetical protein